MELGKVSGKLNFLKNDQFRKMALRLNFPGHFKDQISLIWSKTRSIQAL